MIDDDETQFLSSGTEDIFASSYYFDAGIYHDDQVGLTYISKPGAMSAYKFFMADPMIFTKSLSLVWRVGETEGIHNNNGCPNIFDNSTSDTTQAGSDTNFDNPMLTNATVTTYAWVYEYQLS